MPTSPTQTVIPKLQANWIWLPDWIDSSTQNTAGRLVRFNHKIHLPSSPSSAVIHCTADTRYKLFINGARVAVGPARSSTLAWSFDTLDISPWLKSGSNEIRFDVVRYFAAAKAALPFERTALPGLTVHGIITSDGSEIEISSAKGWTACIHEGLTFPTGLIDDGFLHISERITPSSPTQLKTPRLYGIKTLNGDLATWRLQPRSIPMPTESACVINIVRACNSDIAEDKWQSFLINGESLVLSANSRHTIDLQAEAHSTAFLKWMFYAKSQSQLTLKAMYSEGYELEPLAYPFFRRKADRLCSTDGHIIGPYDLVTFDLAEDSKLLYEPFWFRTFRLIRLELSIGAADVELKSFVATQVNYPLSPKAEWSEPQNPIGKQIWDISVRTIRNCLFDGYSDCPFYEQLQYCCDSRSVALFHYLLSGDDRLMRRAITDFAASITPEGLTQSRFPSQVRQTIAGFSLYWVLAICDHVLYFGDTQFAKSFLPRIDGVFDFFEAHLDTNGLVSDLPNEVWQYVDWVTSWGATDEHPDKGVPTSGRKINFHTYFSLLYAYVLRQAVQLLRSIGRPAHAEEYASRADSLVKAVRKSCYDGRFFTDSSASIAGEDAYSQHCQVFAVLSGAAEPQEAGRLLLNSMSNPDFSKCSYMMKFYLFRALSIAGDEVYNASFHEMMEPWREMIANNLSTCEEDDVRQRSDCHAWGSVPIYEYCVEIAGVHPVGIGCSKILFKPRLSLSRELCTKFVIGKDNMAEVSWSTGSDGAIHVELRLSSAIEVTSKLPGQASEVTNGITDSLTLTYGPDNSLASD